MFDQALRSKLGTVIHRLTAVAIWEGIDPGDTDELARQWWKAAQLGGTTSWQTRTHATLMVANYLRRLRPLGWDLLSAETSIGRSEPDLVWVRRTDGQLTDVFIDEIKTGRRAMVQPELPDQIRRLGADGAATWPGLFRGIRICDLQHMSKVGFWTSDGTHLTRVAGPTLRTEVER